MVTGSWSLPRLASSQKERVSRGEDFIDVITEFWQRENCFVTANWTDSIDRRDEQNQVRVGIVNIQEPVLHCCYSDVWVCSAGGGEGFLGKVNVN
jgi:hypothetical protein